MRTSILVLAGLVLLLSAWSALPHPAQAQEPSPAQRAGELFSKADYAAALPLYEKLVQADAQNGQAWFRLAMCAHFTGQLERAIEANTKAAAFQPFAAHAYYNLACEQALLGRTEAALSALSQALASGFADAEALAKDSDLASLWAEARFAALVEAARGETQGVARQFDFWVGEWEVFDSLGQRVGSNRIEKAERGNLIQEHWTDAGGRTGQSMNYVDPADGLWHQLWVADDGEVGRWSGSWSAGSMRLQGTRHMLRGGVVASRLSFTPNADGSVRQLFEESSDGGATWAVGFDGLYRRKG